jgi:hypothetical protein
MAAVVFSAVVVPVVAGEVERLSDPCPAGSARSPSAQFPSRQYPTLQSAVCGVQDGGLVVVGAGAHKMRATIWGKRVRIHGVGRDLDPSSWPTLHAPLPGWVPPAERALGILTVAVRGSLSVRRLKFVGGDAGIVVHDRAGLANALDVQRARFSRGSRGVLFLSTAGLVVKHTTFAGILHNGVSVYTAGRRCTKKINVENSDFIGIANAAVLIRDCNFISAADGFFHGLALQATEALGGDGLLLINSGPFTLSGLDISGARGFAIAAIGSTAIIQNTVITNTSARPDGHFGDGIVAGALPAPGGPASVEISNTYIYATERAGVSNFGSYAFLQDVTIGAAAINLAGENHLGHSFWFEDGGGNVCFDPLKACQVRSEGLAPPPAIVDP